MPPVRTSFNAPEQSSRRICRGGIFGVGLSVPIKAGLRGGAVRASTAVFFHFLLRLAISLEVLVRLDSLD